MAASSRASKVGLQSDLEMEGQIQPSWCAAGPLPPLACTVAIPAFDAFQTARRGAAPSNIILAKGNASEPVSGAHGSQHRAEGPRQTSKVSDTALGTVP